MERPSTREAVRALREHFTGAEIARLLGRSETAIYKHLRVLKEEEGTPADEAGVPSGAEAPR